MGNIKCRYFVRNKTKSEQYVCIGTNLDFEKYFRITSRPR